MKRRTSALRKILIALPVLVVAAVVAASTFVKVRDTLAQQRASIEADWSAVDDALQERAALIQDFAEAAQQSGIPVNGIRQQIADAHAELQHGVTPRARMQANDRLSLALGRLMEATDIHPAHGHAKSTRSLSRIEEQIRDSEERIAVARRKYNETLEHYNAGIQTFPRNVVAKIAGFRRNDAYFQTEPF